MVLDGHVQGIYSIAFSPNGSVFHVLICASCAHHTSRYQVASGAGDDTIRLWDIRSLRALYTIPAHKSNVADVRFFRLNEGVSAPADVNMGNGDTEADPEKSNDNVQDKAQEEWRYRSGLYLASGGYDGLVKIWSADDWQLLRTLTTDASKVMSVDWSPDMQLLASGTYNRNFQLFSMDDSLL
jgi:U4/U6 small nuclear ribonucleoprotein PRP4